jgi:SAM-dependent methyltransferase
MVVLDEIRDWWDEDAATYDAAPGHHPRTGPERAAWTAAIAALLPAPPSRVLDCGAGTGFLSLIAARLGHQVTALDLSGEMLARLAAKAADQGLTSAVATVHAAATEPPGHHDTVIERHLIWTLPDPVAALVAWRAAADRLVLLESLWGNADPFETLRGRIRRGLHRLLSRPDDHHGEYSPGMRSALPLGRGTPPGDLIALVEEAGWQTPRLIRLRDVEWATRLALPPWERLLGPTPRFAVVAEAGRRA